jgi:hypothetical protein
VYCRTASNREIRQLRQTAGTTSQP